MYHIEMPGLQHISAAILAGGRGKRMRGQDKGLLPLGGRPLVEWVIDGIKPQVGQLLINSNRNLEAYQRYGYPVISDRLGDFQGPLAGIAAALACIHSEYLLTLPCDGPLVAPDLAERLFHPLESGQFPVSVAHDGNRLQSVYTLIHRDCAHQLQEYLDSGDRKVELWLQQQRAVVVDFSDRAKYFRNLNRPEDISGLRSPT